MRLRRAPTLTTTFAVDLKSLQSERAIPQAQLRAAEAAFVPEPGHNANPSVTQTMTAAKAAMAAGPPKGFGKTLLWRLGLSNEAAPQTDGEEVSHEF